MRGRGSAWRCRWGGFWGCVRGEVVVCTVGGGARRMYHGAANTEALLTMSRDQKVQDYSEPFSPELAAQGRESAQCCGKDGCGVQVARTRAAPVSPRFSRAIVPILAGPGIFLVRRAHRSLCVRRDEWTALRVFEGYSVGVRLYFREAIL